jgi:hypothetical protein
MQEAATRCSDCAPHLAVDERAGGLGVSRSGQQHSPAICVQHRGLMSHPAIEDIRKRTKDEVDVRTGARCPPSRPQPCRPASRC